MNNRQMVNLAFLSCWIFLGFLANLLFPAAWLAAPIVGYGTRRYYCHSWTVVILISTGLFLGGLVAWFFLALEMFGFFGSLIGATTTVTLFLAGALACQIQILIEDRHDKHHDTDTPSDPSGGSSVFRRLLPKWKQDDHDSHHLQTSVMPTV
jgi:hypothetical protein